MVLALEGIRILDLTMLFPGPFGTRYFADFGAEIIKIESKVREDMARLPPPIVKFPEPERKIAIFIIV